MTEREELIFGLKRWIRKAISYLDSRSVDEFIKDEKSFDASLYCFLVISEISSKIEEDEVLKEEYKEIKFNEIKKIYNLSTQNDNYDISFIYHILNVILPQLLSLLIYHDKFNERK